MHRLIQECVTHHTPESLVERLHGEPGVILLRTGLFHSPLARYSLVAARPFACFTSHAAHCELRWGERYERLFGDPWRLLADLMARFELQQRLDLPFPLGGCFGYWGYELKHFVEPKLKRRTIDDLELPDCRVGFYSSLVVFDHLADKTWIVSTGLTMEGSVDEVRAARESATWLDWLQSNGTEPDEPGAFSKHNEEARLVGSNLTRAEYLSRVRRAQIYIHSGDIYQVNLAHRISAPFTGSGWHMFQRLSAISPAPFSAYLDAGDFQLASSSPELFLRLSGRQIETYPIKGTRPRSSDPLEDARLAYALQTSTKEMAELVMITDLLRNDLGRICHFGSVSVPDLARLERFPHVQHLVSAVHGTLHSEVTHLAALARCFPGGSITGAPKFRAMEIIEELEPNTRGPFTGALGYLGFNGESQLSIIIRTAIVKNGMAHFPVGAGIVADSVPEAEYEETLAKAQGFFLSIGIRSPTSLEKKTVANSTLNSA